MVQPGAQTYTLIRFEPLYANPQPPGSRTTWKILYKRPGDLLPRLVWALGHTLSEAQAREAVEADIIRLAQEERP